MSELSTAGIKERFCWVSSGRWWWEGLFLSLLTEILVTLLTKLVSVFLLFQFCPEVRQSWMNGWKAETFLEILIDIWLEMGKLTKYSKSSNRHWLKDVRVSKSPWFFFFFYCSLHSPLPCAVSVLFHPFLTCMKPASVARISPAVLPSCLKLSFSDCSSWPHYVWLKLQHETPFLDWHSGV